MSDTNTQMTLIPASAHSGTVINSRCIVYEEEGMLVVVAHGQPVFTYHREDKVAEALFIAQAQELGLAKPGELSAALEASASTVYRIRQRYLAEGAAGLVLKKRGPKGSRLGEAREAAIRRWHQDGKTAYWMGKRLRVCTSTVRDALIRMGLPTRQLKGEQLELTAPAAKELEPSAPGRAEDNGPEPVEREEPAVEPQAEEAEVQAAVVAERRGAVEEEREQDEDVEEGVAVEAAAGVEMETGTKAETTADAETQQGAEVGEGTEPATETHAAVQIAVSSETEKAPLPVLSVETTLDSDPLNREIDRMLAAAGQLDDAAPLFAPGKGIPRAGVLLAVPLLVASGVFESARQTYGHIGPAFYGLRTIVLTLLLLTLLRIKHPENVKEYSPPELGRILGLDRAPEVKTIRRKLERLAVEGRSEVFLLDLVKRRVKSHGQALGFLYVDGHVRVYSGQADLPKTHVARMRICLPATQDTWVNDADGTPLFFVTEQAHPSLVSALPPVLAEIRELVGPDRRVTVVFDRGGWSPKLFRRMDLAGFDVLTYRKGKSEPVPEEAFQEYEVPGSDGKLTYELHDTTVPLLKGKWSMRQVTRRKGDHQTKIMTTRRDLSVVEVAVRMFNRWRQENFFKYMRQEFAFDALVEYGVEEDDPSRLVPNPARKEMDRKVSQAKKDVAELETAYGAAAIDNPESKRPTSRGFKIANGTKIGIPLRKARVVLAGLLEKRNQVPTKVPVGQIKDEVVRLPRHKKRLADGMKMLAYQVETDLVRAVTPFYARNLDEGRTLISTALQSTGAIEVSDDELLVTLVAQSSPHRSQAIARLCTLLNATETCFPGTSLRLHYAVAGVESVT